MSKIIPIVSLSGHLALQAIAGGSTALSSEASDVYRASTKVIDSTERSLALFGNKSAALSRLASLIAECADSGWDGGDALAVDPIAGRLAERFVRALPDSVSLPEFAAEPDGSISLDWIQSRTRLFSLSVGRSSRLAYAWLDGANKGHGVVGFDGRNIPSQVLEGITDIMGQGHVGLWAA
jgi:hypothetical protein